MPVSQRVQMNFIFNDNVRILCLSCNVKNVGKLVRFKQKGQKQASFLAFHNMGVLVIYSHVENTCIIITLKRGDLKLVEPCNFLLKCLYKVMYLCVGG
jgi:hypothetical protein